MALVTLFSSLYLTKTFNSLGSLIIAAIILFSFPLLLIRKENNFNTSRVLVLLIYVLTFFGFLSAIKNSDINVLFNVMILSALLISGFFVFPSLRSFKINEIVYKTVIYLHIPILIVPVLFNGIGVGSYSGIFYNPNAFGSVVATVFLMVYATFLFELENIYIGKLERKVNGWALLLHIVILFTLLFFIVLSGSRTSLITAIIGLIIGGVLLLSIFFINKKILSFIKSFFYFIISGIILYVIIKVTPFYNYLNNNIIYKFERKIEQGDVLDARGLVWQQTISEFTFLGHGSQYFSKTIAAAHNTFIGILGEFGLIYLILFIMILLLMLNKSVKYVFMREDDKYKYLPIMLITCFGVLSMGESMMFKLSMITMIYSIGSLYQYRI